jgi:hypothetical protein
MSVSRKADAASSHDLTDVTRDLAKNSTEDVKTLASFPEPSVGSIWTHLKVCRRFEQPAQQIEQAKISRDFQTAIMSFQRISKLSAERQKQFVKRQKENLPTSSTSRSPALYVPLRASRLAHRSAAHKIPWTAS